MSARGGKSQLSMASLRDKASDLREKASGLPRRKACHWVAQWFTLPQLTTKILSFVRWPGVSSHCIRANVLLCRLLQREITRSMYFSQDEMLGVYVLFQNYSLF